ncbi:hypothetical protein OG474_30460 [Kribbella sp. NBC_01505]|uniref:hypothetical protein n=1 Tax=Kribbella sp. NBC_01505 TaxID=2903580 RepID=UPI003862FDA4
MSDEAQIVGRIAVKVWPDTSGFRKKLKADLTAIEQTLDRIEIKLDLDTSGLAAKAKAVSEAVQAQLDTIKLRINENSIDSLKAALKRIDREIEKLDEIDFEVSLDRESLAKAQAELTKKLADAARIKVELDNRAFRAMRDRIDAELRSIQFNPTVFEDPRRFAKLRRDIEKTLAKIHELEASITPEMSERDKHAVESDIADLRDKLDELKTTEIKPDLNSAWARIVVGELAVLARTREVSLLPVVSKNAAAKAGATLAALAGARVLNDLVRNLARSLGQLDRNVPIIGTIAEAIAGLAAWALSAASNLFSLSASLAQIGGLAFALPGIFGGVAIGLGATIAVLKDFNTVLPQVKTQLAGLQDRMSAKFWKVAEAPIRRLVDHLFPEVSAGLEATAANLGVFFGGLSTALTKSFDGLLAAMFKDLNSSILIAAGATSSLASTIATLGKVGAGYLPKLASWFTDIAKQFNGWITKAAADGRLQAWIDNATFAIKELGRASAGIGRILAGLAQAAQKAGGSTLTTLADSLDRAAKVINGATFQDALMGTLRAAQFAMTNLSNAVGPGLEKLFLSLAKTAETVLPLVGEDIGQLLGSIAAALAQPAVQQGLLDLFDGLGKAIQGLLPALPQVGRALASLGSIVGTLASRLGPALGAALAGLADIVTILAPKLQPILDILGFGLTNAIEILAPQLAKIATALANLITPELLAQLGAVVGNTLLALQDNLPLVADSFVKLLQAVAPVIPPLMDFAIRIIPKLSESLVKLLQGLLPVIDVLGKLIAIAAKGIKPIADLTVALTGPGALEAISALFSAVSKLVRSLPRLWELLTTEASAGFKALTAAISSAWSSITTTTSSAVSTIASRTKAGFAQVVSVIASRLSDARTTAASAWSAIVSNTGATLGPLVAAVRRVLDQALAVLKSLPGRAVDAMGPLGTVLAGAGRSLIGGLVSGIRKSIPSVQGVLAGLTASLPDWKGPPEKDKKLLQPAGRQIIDGFIVGIREQIPVLRGALQSLTNAIPSMVKVNIGKVNSVIASMSRVLTAQQKAHLNALINQAQTGVAAVEKAQAALAGKVKAAQTNLDNLKKAAADYASEIFDKIVAPGDIGSGDDHSYVAIVANLTKARDAAIQFEHVLDQLRKAGLSKAALDQIAQAGPDAGLAAGKSILAAGKKGIGEINALQAQLAKAASAAAKVAADAQYANGIRIAEGLLKGLQRMQKPLDAQMTRLADVLVAAIKKALKIKSPSRVFMRLGGHVGQGFAIGITNARAAVDKALSAMADHRAVGSRISGAVDSALATSTPSGSGRTLHYYAAPGSSISSEEDLFTAAERSRMVNW